MSHAKRVFAIHSGSLTYPTDEGMTQRDDQIAGNESRKRKRFSEKKDARPKLIPQERARLIREGKCFGCGEPGHICAKCLKKTPKEQKDKDEDRPESSRAAEERGRRGKIKTGLVPDCVGTDPNTMDETNSAISCLLITFIYLLQLGRSFRRSSLKNVVELPPYVMLIVMLQIKWIVPTAPVQPVAVMAGFPCNAWFDVGSLTEEGPDDLEGLDASAAHIAELLSKESANVKLGVGGFSQGAATSMYTTACSFIGSYSDGTDFPCKLDITVGISGWLPSAKTLESRFKENPEAMKGAKGYSIFLGHGTSDEIVVYKFGQQSAAALQSLGFSNLVFKTYKGARCLPLPPLLRVFLVPSSDDVDDSPRL
ncbi:hypothetical protein L7F22_016474 [Adiantum nelumboides]|nr:hypothetical protein [Adiantum nelumboides]